MSKKNNGLALYVLVCSFAFISGFGQVKADEYKNYFGINMNNEEYNTLLNLGFSEEEIYYMDENTFDENKDLDATLVAQNEKYYKTIYTNLAGESTSVEVTETEYNNQSTMGSRGTVETAYKKMVSTLSQNGSKFRYKVSVSWKNMPSVRSYDIIGVGFDDPVYISSPVYFNYYSCDSSGNCSTSTQYYDKKKTSTGGSAVYKFPSSVVSMSSNLYYDVSKNTSSTITRLDMYGDYAHATTSISGSNAMNHLITHNGIELSSNISYYDAIPCAQSAWSGTW